MLKLLYNPKVLEERYSFKSLLPCIHMHTRNIYEHTHTHTHTQTHTDRQEDIYRSLCTHMPTNKRKEIHINTEYRSIRLHSAVRARTRQCHGNEVVGSGHEPVFNTPRFWWPKPRKNTRRGEELDQELDPITFECS